VVFRIPFMPLLFSCGTLQYLPPEQQNPTTTELHGVTPQELSDNAVPILSATTYLGIPWVNSGGETFDSFYTAGGAR